MKHLTPILAVVALALPLGAAAQTHTHDHKSVSAGTKVDDAGADGVKDAAAKADGEIRRIDKDGGKVTIRHGEIRQLDMPPMTMVFHARNAAMLDQVKVGDKIRFAVVHEGGKYVVTEIEAAR